MERKDQSDKGNKVFNCEENQKHLFTALNIYKKEHTHKFRDDPGRMDVVELIQ